jgi:branched-chain amino acid transport system permease protein
MGSIAGAFLASLLVGLLQTFAIGVDRSLLDVARLVGFDVHATGWGASWLRLSVSQVAPILPYVLLVATLVVRPRGLLGTRD